MSYGHKFQIFLLLVLGSCYICVLDHHSNSSLVNIRPPSLRHGLSLSDLSNPILLPPRLTYCTDNKTEGGPNVPQQEGKRTRVGCSFSPLEHTEHFVIVFLMTSSWILHSGWLQKTPGDASQPCGQTLDRREVPAPSQQLPVCVGVWRRGTSHLITGHCEKRCAYYSYLIILWLQPRQSTSSL